MPLSQSNTGVLSELRVKQKLESLGLIVKKPIPDVGVDFEVFNPNNGAKSVKIQVKGRNPRFIKSYRWFQIRVPRHEMELSRKAGISANETWKRKLRLVDFFILDSIHFDEMWVLSQEQTFELIRLNEHQYGRRPDNIFHYKEPIKGCQKEMNLEAFVPEKSILEEFSICKENFSPILSFLGM